MAQPAPHVADPYRTLGVARAATDAEIKAAHRKLAKRFHPDAGEGDTRRFLRVQEAYRVLSDPLLRREWDARHAPGPVRADRGERPPRATRSRATTATAAKAASRAEPAADQPRPSEAQRDPRREPRSSRAYTWSATEVPWWEEGAQRDAKRRPRPAGAPQQPTSVDAPNEFDVYNRSSGAAWSMAARAYFRRGDQDLPRRGSFHHQGSQPLTAARARTAAEQERRRAAASAASAAAASTAQAVPPPPAPAPSPAQATAAPRSSAAAPSRDRAVQRALPREWPGLGQRLVYALIAWLPFAAAVMLASSARIDEVMQGALMAITLGVLAAVPRLAYVLAVATLGLLVIGCLMVIGLIVLGVQLPLSAGTISAVGAALALGYIATAGMVALGPSGLRPWTRHVQPVRSR